MDLEARLLGLSEPAWESLFRQAARCEPRLLAVWQVAVSREMTRASGAAAVAGSPLAYRPLLSPRMAAFAEDFAELLRLIEQHLDP